MSLVIIPMSMLLRLPYLVTIEISHRLTRAWIQADVPIFHHLLWEQKIKDMIKLWKIYVFVDHDFAIVKKLTQFPRYKNVGIKSTHVKTKTKEKEKGKKEKIRPPIIRGFVAKQTRKMILSKQPIISWSFQHSSTVVRC